MRMVRNTAREALNVAKTGRSMTQHESQLYVDFGIYERLAEGLAVIP